MVTNNPRSIKANFKKCVNWGTLILRHTNFCLEVWLIAGPLRVVMMSLNQEFAKFHIKIGALGQSSTKGKLYFLQM